MSSFEAGQPDQNTVDTLRQAIAELDTRLVAALLILGEPAAAGNCESLAAHWQRAEKLVARGDSYPAYATSIVSSLCAFAQDSPCSKGHRSTGPRRGQKQLLAFMSPKGVPGAPTEFDGGINRQMGMPEGVYHFAFEAGSAAELAAKRLPPRRLHSVEQRARGAHAGADLAGGRVPSGACCVQVLRGGLSSRIDGGG